MRVLFLYPYLPTPEAPHGSARLVSRLLADVKDHAEVTVVCAYRPSERRWIPSVERLCHRLIPVERRFASDMRLLERTREMGATGVKRLGTGYPTSVVKLRRSLLRTAILQARLAEFDVAHVELATMAQYVDLLSGLPSVLIDHEAAGSGEEPARWLRYVRDTYPQFSRRLCLSLEDGREVESLVGLPVGVRRPGMDIPEARDRSPEPNRVLFFGSGDHAPNRDGLQWIAREILPALRALRPEVRLVCAGFRPPWEPEAEEAAAAGVELLGFVPDLSAELQRAAVVLAPLRLGGGVRIKNLETLAHRVPLVTTPLGMRGLTDIDPRAVGQAADAQGLAELVSQRLSYPKEAQAAADLGLSGVRQWFSFERQALETLNLWQELAGTPL